MKSYKVSQKQFKENGQIPAACSNLRFGFLRQGEELPRGTQGLAPETTGAVAQTWKYGLFCMQNCKFTTLRITTT